MARVDEIAAQEMQRLLSILDSSITDYIKLESFGIFLQDYVISGGEVSQVSDLKVKVSECILSLRDFIWRVFETTLNVPSSNGLYYIIFDANNQKFACVTQFPDVYMELAQVMVNNGAIINITDTRGEVGGIRFNEDVVGIISENLLIDSPQIKDKAVINSKLADNSVGTNNIQNGSVTYDKIANNAIDESKLQDASVSNDKLQGNSVDDRVLALEAVENEHIVDRAVTGNKIALYTIEANNIKNGTITTNKIANGAITKDKIANGAIDSSKLSIDGVFPESTLKLDYPTAWLYEVINRIQLEDTGNLIEIINARQGYKTLSEKIDSLETTISHESFIASEGQTHFVLTKGEYEPGTNTLFVTVGGIPQDITSGITEINSTSFSVDEPLPAGTEVFVWWYNKQAIPTTYHAKAHKAGGGDSIDLGELAHNQPVVIDGGEW